MFKDAFKNLSSLILAASLGVVTGANLKVDATSPQAHAMDVRRVDLPDGGVTHSETVYGSVVPVGKPRLDIGGAPCKLSITDQALVDSVMANSAVACVAERAK